MGAASLGDPGTARNLESGAYRRGLHAAHPLYPDAGE